jgi:hypothetical protein
MSSPVLAATTIARAERRFVIEASPPPPIDDALRAYRECVTELCARAGVSEMECLVYLGNSFPGPLGLASGARRA